MSDFLLMVSGALFAMLVSGIVNYGKREWVGLTDEEQQKLYEEWGGVDGWGVFYSLIESKLKEKNT